MFPTVIKAVNFMHPGAVIIVMASLVVLIAFEKIPFLINLKAIPSALVAVLTGVIINETFRMTGSTFLVGPDHLVSLPIPKSMTAFLSQFSLPDFNQITNKEVWVVAMTIAAVASIETLLSIEASDKLDPLKRYTNTNQELKAQGIGNIISCMIGGIPLTSVIVRSSANVNSGGRTKIAAISHGIFLMLAVLLIPMLLNRIPLASLAAVLIVIGYKLASPKVFVHMWKNSKKFQFIPFVVTVVAVVFSDILIGVGIGLTVSIYFILRGNLKLAYFFKQEDYSADKTIHMELAQEVSFLNKAAIKQTFAHLPENSKLVLDASHSIYIDHDVLILIKEFVELGSKEKNIEVKLMGFRKEYKIENTDVHVTTVLSDNDKPVSRKEVHPGVKVPSNALNVEDLSDDT